MENLTTTKEKILEAASKCSTAKATLEILFPEAFEDCNTIEELAKASSLKLFDANYNGMIQPRTSGEHIGKCFFLHPKFNWSLTKDSEDAYCLTPTLIK